MSTTTQCPQCGTRFKATQAQLQAYHGMVRCGHCQAAFDAIAHQCDDELSPQLILPIEGDADAEQLIDLDTGASPEMEQIAEDILSSAQQGLKLENKKRVWPLVVASLVLSMILAGQSAYLFRVEIAAHLPGIKPELLAACHILNCDIPLPRDANLVSIESSDMQADPTRAGIIALTITLLNQATYTQAYPNLELTLNDFNDAVVGRRTFHPDEYLSKEDSPATGMPSGREKTVTLTLDTGNLKAAGYRLFLYY